MTDDCRRHRLTAICLRPGAPEALFLALEWSRQQLPGLFCPVSTDPQLHPAIAEEQVGLHPTGVIGGECSLDAAGIQQRPGQVGLVTVKIGVDTDLAGQFMRLWGDG